MAEPTTSRKTLRRAIGKKARMRFYLSYKDQELLFTTSGDSNAGACSTETFFCNKLAQGDGYWEDSYIYVMSTDANIDGLERRIVNFNADQDALYLEFPTDTDEVPTSDDKFELLDIYPAHQVHDGQTHHQVPRDTIRLRLPTPRTCAAYLHSIVSPLPVRVTRDQADRVCQ